MEKRKNWLIAAMAAAMALTFASCGEVDDDDDDDDADSKSVSAAADEGTESKAEEANGDDDKAEESKAADLDASEESKAEEVSKADDTPVSGTIHQGTGYTFAYDEELWADASDMAAGVDCAYSYIGDSGNDMAATANFNIIVQPTGYSGDITPKDYADIVLETYASMDGISVSSSESTTLNGYDAYKVDLLMDQSGFTMDMVQVVMVEDGTIYCISYGAESSVFAELEGEFNNVFGTFKIS